MFRFPPRHSFGKHVVVSLAALALLLSAAVAQARPRSNTMVKFPGKLFAADLTGDGITEWVIYDGKKVFVTDMKFEAHGMAYKRMPHDIKRVFSGHFSSATKETLCLVLTDNSTRCYGLSPDNKFLWWAWTQYNLVADNEEAMAGDFDGDGKDELLIYRPSTGGFKMYERNSSGWFGLHPNFDLGNLANTTYLKNKKVIVGNWANHSGEGVRDDIIIVDTYWRQVMRYDSRVNGLGEVTFWWAFTSKSYVYYSTEELTVANVLGDSTDQIVLHNKGTGGYRFRKAEYSNGYLKYFYQNKGQLSTKANTQLFWVETSKHASEPGGNARDDAMMYDPQYKTMMNYGARYSSSQGKTYWWGYTQYMLDLDADPDGDALTTLVELGGLDDNNNGTSDVPLHHYGASPFGADVFVEVDYMDNAPGVAGDRRMTNAAQQLAIAAMADHNINLHIFQGNQVAYQANLGDPNFDWEDDFDPIKNANFTAARWTTFHYCLMAHGFGGGTWSGISRGIGGSDFIVSLGAFANTDAQQTGTFLHELGHNLGLRHGGVDDVRYKPNHISIMNYNYQMIGIMKDGQARYHYSDLVCSNLNENALFEPDGVQCTGGSGAYQTWLRGPGFWTDINVGVDYNQSGVIWNGGTVKVDLDGDGNRTTLLGSGNEYTSMNFEVGLVGAGVSTTGLASTSQPSKLANRYMRRPLRTLSPTDELDVTRFAKIQKLVKSMPKVKLPRYRTIKTLQKLTLKRN